MPWSRWTRCTGTGRQFLGNVPACWLHVETVLVRSCDPMPACDVIPKWDEGLDTQDQTDDENMKATHKTMSMDVKDLGPRRRSGWPDDAVIA